MFEPVHAILVLIEVASSNGFKTSWTHQYMLLLEAIVNMR